MFFYELKRPSRQMMEEVEELEILLFDNSFNATTLLHEVELGAHCWVLGAERIEGYVLYRVVQGLCDILRVGVHPSYQGRGTGTKLMRQAMTAAPRSMLTVSKTNQGALRLYQKLGFEVVGDLESSWVMATSAES